jgi:hypothetical protein
MEGSDLPPKQPLIKTDEILSSSMRLFGRYKKKIMVAGSIIGIFYQSGIRIADAVKQTRPYIPALILLLLILYIPLLAISYLPLGDTRFVIYFISMPILIVFMIQTTFFVILEKRSIIKAIRLQYNVLVNLRRENKIELVKFYISYGIFIFILTLVFLMFGGLLFGFAVGITSIFWVILNYTLWIILHRVEYQNNIQSPESLGSPAQ